MTQKTCCETLIRQINTLEARLKEQENLWEKDRIAARHHRRFLQFIPYPVLIRNADGLITYLNPAFTQTFGWTLEELKGTHGREYIPVHLQSQLATKIKSLPPGKNVLKLATRRLTKTGQILDMVVRVGIDRDEDLKPAGMVMVFRDVTMEKRIDRNQSAINRISQALPQYPRLPQLLQYVSGEIKELLGTQGANVMLLDEDEKEFYVLSMVHDDPTTQERVKKIRFKVDELLSGQVVKTGKPLIMTSLPEDQQLHKNRDAKIGYRVKNVMVVPLHTNTRIIGVISADNKKEGAFDQTDLKTLSTIAATVALSIENARVSEELEKANEELKGLNAAKDKMISHLSHELKTPVAVLLSSIKILSRRLKDHLPEDAWRPTLERMQRNLKRLIGIEAEVYDIVEKKSFHHKPVYSLIFDECKDTIEALIAEDTGETGVVQKVRKKLDDTFSSPDHEKKQVRLDRFVARRIKALRPLFSHRDVDLSTRLSPVPPILMPLDPLHKVVDGLIRNAVENTPDGCSIHVLVNKRGKGVAFVVQDQGIGLTREAQKRIFEGFFTTQETMQYSSKQPFDFNAGGKGADLLRMKIFSERFNFKISMTSKRCSSLPEATDICPGKKPACDRHPGPPCDGKTRVTVVFTLTAD
ncbi:MAG: GAF domain-containing protein [Desulfotignum sp.]|nr:GAF domain-containing protein [Desulfotignum sp.]MCF8113189.1 GAF domain-containing protein [Desulfotignum sp.]MCF8125644.1 GAF domain-containing protein [Desulfotignum sp.]